MFLHSTHNQQCPRCLLEIPDVFQPVLIIANVALKPAIKVQVTFKMHEILNNSISNTKVANSYIYLSHWNLIENHQENYIYIYI